MTNLSTTTHPAFTSRCVQIRDAQWVCHAINETFPHFSTTKVKPIFEKKLRQVMRNNIEKEYQLSMTEIKNIISENFQTKGNGNIFNKLKNRIKLYFSPHSRKDIAILNYIKNAITKLGIYRDNCGIFDDIGKEPFKSIGMFKNYKQGNCYENAIISDMILKMNGIKNSAVIYLKYRAVPEHAVCVFNRDGSPFEKIINNKSIIIDPWAGKVDFAHNMTKFYENMLSNSITIDTKPHIAYEIHEPIEISDYEIEKLRQKYPKLIFKSTRNFMNK